MSEQITKEALQKMLSDTIVKEVGGMKETIEKSINDRLDAEIKKISMDKINVKSAGFSPEELAKMSRYEKTAQFVKAVFRKDAAALASLKTGMLEGTDSQGGFLVPQETQAEIDRIIEDFGFIRKMARKLPMSRDVLNMPNLATAATVSVPGESTAQTDGSPVLGSTQLVAKTVVGISMLSKELLADANVDLVKSLLELFGEALAGYEDSQGLTGTGSPFTGVLGNANVHIVTMASGKDTFAEATIDDYRDLISQIKSSALPKAVFVMHRANWALLQKQTEASQHISTFQNPIVSGGVQGGFIQPVGYLWGYPVYCNDKMPSVTAVSTKFAIFGNFDYFYFGNRMEMTMDISDSATVNTVNAFASYQQAVRVAERIALAVGVPDAFAVLKTAAS